MKLPHKGLECFSRARGPSLDPPNNALASPTCGIVEKGLVKLGNIPMYRVSTLDFR